MINSPYQNNEVTNSESELLFKKVQFYWNLNKLENAHASYAEDFQHLTQVNRQFEVDIDN